MLKATLGCMCNIFTDCYYLNAHFAVCFLSGTALARKLTNPTIHYFLTANIPRKQIKNV